MCKEGFQSEEFTVVLEEVDLYNCVSGAERKLIFSLLDNGVLAHSPSWCWGTCDIVGSRVISFGMLRTFIRFSSDLYCTADFSSLSLLGFANFVGEGIAGNRQ